MFWVRIKVTDDGWTRYPQSFPTKNAAEEFQKNTKDRFPVTEVFEEVTDVPAPVGLNDEDLAVSPPQDPPV